jgi:dipeptidyl aminopeptidase/acylaminoacyl peptidase
MRRFVFSAMQLALVCAAIVFGVKSLHAAESAKGLYLADAEGELRLVMPWEEGFAITSPQQSPDGQWIAFDKSAVFNEAGQPDPAHDHICIVPSAGGKAKDLGPGAVPTWSQDSKQICFAIFEGAPEGKPGVYIMGVDGNGREWLFEGEAGRLSPDGSRIAYFKNGDVYVFDILAGESTHIGRSGFARSGTPAWSPDGEQIVFTYRSNADHTLALLDSKKESQQPKVLVEGFGMSRSPSWAPNKKILIFANPNHMNDIYVFDPTGISEREKPFEGKFTFLVKDPAWAADGESIVFIKAK